MGGWGASGDAGVPKGQRQNASDEHSGLIIPEHGTDMAQKWKPPLETLARRVLLPYDTGIDAKGYDAIIGAFR